MYTWLSIPRREGVAWVEHATRSKAFRVLPYPHQRNVLTEMILSWHALSMHKEDTVYSTVGIHVHSLHSGPILQTVKVYNVFGTVKFDQVENLYTHTHTHKSSRHKSWLDRTRSYPSGRCVCRSEVDTRCGTDAGVSRNATNMYQVSELFVVWCTCYCTVYCVGSYIQFSVACWS